MEWERHTDKEKGWSYFKKETFNGFTYYLEVYVDISFKTEIYWFALASGKKRKDFDVFEQKENKSRGGIQALLWAKREILAFPEWFRNPLSKRRYIAIRWSDARRRNIYSRLEKEGFQFQMIAGEKVLIKKIND